MTVSAGNLWIPSSEGEWSPDARFEEMSHWEKCETE